MSKKKSLFVQDARTLIENAAKTPEIAKVLSGYGYTEARFKEGMDLLSAAETLSMRKSMEHGEKIEATASFSKAWRDANAMYAKALKIARVALSDDAKSMTGLMMTGARKQSFSGWCVQAGTFYTNLLGDRRLMAKMARFGYTQEVMAKEKAEVDAAMSRYQYHALQSGEAQLSTQAKDRKLAELDDWVSDLRAVCEVAFYDRREELERLGPLAPIRRRRQARKAAPSPMPAPAPSV